MLLNDLKFWYCYTAVVEEFLCMSYDVLMNISVFRGVVPCR